MENRKTVGNVVSALQGVDMWRVVLLESESDLNLIRMRIKGYASNIVTMLRNHAMMLVISEHQTGMEVHRDIDVQDLSDQESMMSLTLET